LPDRRSLARYLAPLVVAYGITGWALHDQAKPTGDVCGMGRHVIDVITSANVPGGQGIASKATTDRILASIDFGLLEREVPPELRDDVELLRRGLRQFVAVYLHREQASDQLDMDPRTYDAASRVIDWATKKCR
jgi:hypothetical protein